MKIQTEFIRVGEATTYFEQYFETQTLKKLSSTNWRLIQDVVDDLAQILSDDNKVIVDIKILEQ
jgi:hypothetical protein